MRLIDADEVIKDMQYYYDDCAKTNVYTRLGFKTAIEVVRDSPTAEAIPKAEYEARLKADIVAMLTEILTDFDNHIEPNSTRIDCESIIEQKIQALEGKIDGEK